MANDEDREEYVNNDHGRVWVGSPQSSRPWYFAQFEDECYEVVMSRDGQIMGYICPRLQIKNRKLRKDFIGIQLNVNVFTILLIADSAVKRYDIVTHYCDCPLKVSINSVVI